MIHVPCSSLPFVALWVWMCARLLSCVWLFGTPWTIACQAPLSVEFSRQEYWSGLPFPTSRILPDSGSNLSLLNLLHWQGVLYSCAAWESLFNSKPSLDCRGTYPLGRSVLFQVSWRYHFRWTFVIIPFHIDFKLLFDCFSLKYSSLWITDLRLRYCTWVTYIPSNTSCDLHAQASPIFL